MPLSPTLTTESAIEAIMATLEPANRSKPIRRQATREEALLAIVLSYPVYNARQEFGEGFVAYQFGRTSNPHNPNSVAAQAWDRGCEASMRIARFPNCGLED